MSAGTGRAHERVDVHHLLVLRAVAIAGQLLAVVIAGAVLDIPLPVIELVGVIAALTVFNTIAWWRLRPHYELSSPAAGAHLAVDVLGLTALLYLTGGATNPFVTLFLLPLTLAATTLPARWTWGLSGLTFCCYTLVLVSYRPLAWPGPKAQAFDLHVVGMWLAFMLSAGVIAVFVVGTTRRLARRERELASERARNQRDREVVALGGLAANTAHELGNPLATIDLLALELEEGDAADAATAADRERIATLRAEVARCTSALRRLSAGAGGINDQGGLLSAERYLQRIARAWSDRRGDVRVDWHWDGPRPAPVLRADATLEKAVGNLLDNAARVSPTGIAFDAYWDDADLTIAIADRGPGPPAATGDTELTQHNGLGIGLFLARSVIEHLDGTLALGARAGGGCTARISIPLDRLTPTTQTP